MTILIKFNKIPVTYYTTCVIRYIRLVEIKRRVLLFTDSGDLDTVRFESFALKRKETIAILGCTSYLNRLQN